MIRLQMRQRLASYPYLLQEIFKKVEFKQANLANMTSVEKVFQSEHGAFNYVFNLAAETKYSQTEEVRW